MRVTLDSSILLRAYSSPDGSAARLVRELSTRGHVIVVSDYLLDEVQRVFLYPRIQVRTAISPASIAERLNELRSSATVALPFVEYPVILADPKG